jgi:tetratricopeptide (TPR) repeat protein
MLRLLDRRAFVGFPPVQVAPGLTIADFGLLIPDVTFPFNLAGGPSRYQRKTLLFGFLELTVDAELVTRRVGDLAARVPELDDLKLFFRPGYLEAQARMKTAERTPVTFKVAFDGEGERLALYLYDVRLYGFTPTPASQLAVALSRAVRQQDLLPEVELKGASGFTTRLLPPLCQLAAVSRGYKVPALDTARLSAAEVSPRGLKLRFASGGLPPPTAPDEELLLALEGARAFADAEELVAAGKLAEAREAYLKLGDVTEAHPFAAERLLMLLVADPQAHELALDVAAAVQRRRERSACALWAEGVVRERRGEHARAAERYLALCALARKNGEEASAFFAAESAARVARDHAPQMAVRALHELLGLRPDHLPSLQQLARSSDQAKDRAGAIRAYRRIAALARDPAEAADAHVHMARLCAETEDDVAGARLHCEAALKLQPDHPEALYQLGELCHRAGEHLRAIKALDRLREVALARHEIDRIGRANLLAGRVWEDGLKQPENALLRYREAVSLMPSEPEPHYRAARVAEGLGKVQEAVAGYLQAVELAGPAPRTEEIRRAAHAAHHALSRLYRTRLGDPARAKESLEAALVLDPRDMAALEELIPYYRAAGRAAELADACEKAAAVTDDPVRRAAFWAEAGELYRGRLGQLDKAEKLLDAALGADEKNRTALEAMLALAESRRDGAQLCRCLKGLAALATDAKERARHLRRLAVAARDLTFDLDLATYALTEVLRLEPEDLASIGELCGLHRRRADMTGLASALEMRARVAEAHGDRRLAAAALREMAQVLELRLGRVGEALVAMEKAARLSPDQAILLDLADLSLRCDRPDHARTALTELLGSLPKHAAPERVAEVHARMGRACDQLGDRDAAREHYARAFPLRRLDDELAARLEALHREANDTRALAELWADRAQAMEGAGRPDAAAPLFLRSAQALLELKEAPAALVRLGAALAAAPEGEHAPEILELTAATELQQGNTLEAARLLARRAGLFQDARAAARLLLKASVMAQGSAREETYLSQAIQKDPAFAPARLRRARRELEANPRAALADLEAALESRAGEPDALPGEERLEASRLAAQAATRSGQREAARKHLAFYAAHRPDDLEAQVDLAGLHRAAGDREALCDLLGEIWPRLSGAAQPQALREYAELSLQLGRPAAAGDALRALLERDRASTWAARTLLQLLPRAPSDAAEVRERVELLSVLAETSGGDDRAQLLQERAQLYRGQGRLTEARADLAEAARLSSAPRELLRQAAELAREAGDEAGELAAWRSAVARDPGLSDAAGPRLLALARARLKAGDLRTAREGFAACAALTLPAAERCEAYLGMAEAELGLGDPSAAAEAFAAAARQGPAPRRFEALMRRADLLEAAGQREGAAESLAQALQLSPRHPEATARLRGVLTALEDWEALAELLSSDLAAASGPGAAPLAYELGRLYLDRLSMPGPAEAALQRAARLDRSHVEARRLLADLLFGRGEVDKAADLLEEAAAAQGPAEASALLLAGARRAEEAGEPRVAVRLARRGLSLRKPEGEDLYRVARLLYLRGAAQEALPLYESLFIEADVADAPDRAEEIGLALGDLAEQTGELVLAERTLRRVLQDRPWSEAGAERLAAIVARRSVREAVDILFAHAQKRTPSEQTARFLQDLATRARSELSDVDLTASILLAAARMARDPLPVRRELADLYRQAGRTAELLEQLAEVARLCREAGEITDAIEAHEEQAALAQSSGRVDEALQTLAAVRELWEAQKSLSSAAEVERRRAMLFADLKLDQDAAAEALERSFQLHPDPETCRRGQALAARREDAATQVRWLERLWPLLPAPAERAAAQLEAARLYDGALAAPDKAEAAAREALRSVPGLEDAQRLLEALYEREERHAELAAFHEELAAAEKDPARRAARFQKAAALYADRAGRPDAAAAALLAARAATPDDLALTARIAELLHQAGRGAEGAEFDALLLEADPFAEPAYARHRRYLESAGDHQSLAALLLRRAEAQPPAEAARSYLDAAAAFRKVGADEQAALCEARAFEKAPDSDRAFDIARKRAGDDVRRLADVLQQRARAVPVEEGIPLLRERAGALLAAGESLLAAAAYDDLLALAGDDVEALAARAELAASAGGPRAAQPYDRKLLRAGGEALPAPARLKSQLRLGHAALAGGAYRDAADAFQAVVALDPEGDRGREALSLLAEVHARTQNTRGLFDTTLTLARRSTGPEAEALLRRAAELFEEPREAVEALVPLSRLRPADERVVARAAQALRALGRHGELLELYERSAGAIGGRRAAELLLQAARVVEAELRDEERAFELRRRAGELDPDHPEALRAVVEDQRRRGDREGLLASLGKQVQMGGGDPEALAGLRLELAEVASALGRLEVARGALTPLFEAGPGAPGYRKAVEGLAALLARTDEHGALGRVLEARAELAAGGEQAEFLLLGARAHHAAGEVEKAAKLAQRSAEARPAVEALVFSASLWRELDQRGREAQALVRAAEMSPPQARGALLAEAAEASEAAGDRDGAAALLERVAQEHPAALSAEAAADRLSALGRPDRALALGFAPAMAQRRFGRALELADRAGDAARAIEALWALVEAGGAGEDHARRLAEALRKQDDGQGLSRLAALLEGQDAGRAAALHEEIALGRYPPPLRRAAFERLFALDRGAEALDRALDGDLAGEDPGVLDLLLARAREAGGPAWRKALAAVAEAVPARRQELLRERVELDRGEGRTGEAAAALQELISLEEHLGRKSALELELGELWLSAGEEGRARDAFELALAHDALSLPAAKRVLSLSRPEDAPDRFVSLAERVERAEGAEAIAPYRAALVEAYVTVGRRDRALDQLAQLPETQERLERRAQLAGELGRVADSLAVRERLAQTAMELEQLLYGYLEAGLIGPAAKLADRMLSQWMEITHPTQRLLAERMAGEPDGAALAVRLWPELLQREIRDADGWTLFGEALAKLGKVEQAKLADGFGAALTGSQATAPGAAISALVTFPPDFSHPAPPGLVRLGPGSMPRLHGVLAPVLTGLAASSVTVLLDPAGGVEAYLLTPRELVIGVGALSCFGAAELAYLVALGLALAEKGVHLRQPGEVPELERAAGDAFVAIPASLAACRVVARLEASVRGGDPLKVDVPEVLRASAAFETIARRALALI